MPSRASVRLGFGVGIVGISFAALFVRWALPAPPVTTAFYRMLFATAVLAAWTATRPGGQALRGRPLAQALAAGACFGTDLALWHTAIVRTSLANATFLVNTTPIYVGLASWALWRERPTPRFAVGAAAAVVGTALLVGADWNWGGGAADAVRGDVLALAAALFYSGYLLLMKAVRDSTGTISALVAAGVGATAMLGITALVRGDPLTGFPASSWWAFAGAAGVAQLGGVMGVVWSLRYLQASFASVALLAQPLGTAALGWLLLGEALGPAQLAGGAAVATGIVLASRTAADPRYAAGYSNGRSSHQG